MSVVILGFNQDSTELDLGSLSKAQLKKQANNEFLFNNDEEYHDQRKSIKDLLTMTGAQQVVIFKIRESAEHHNISLLKGFIHSNAEDRYKIYKNVEDI